MFYTFELSYNTTDTQVESVLNPGWNDYGRNSLLITAVTTCTFPSQSSIFRPRSVLGYRAWKRFMYHWNIDVICRKISGTTWILISLTNNTSRGNPKRMIVHALWPNLSIWWLSNILAWHDQEQWMTKGRRSSSCPKKAESLHIIFVYLFKLHFAAFF